MQMEWFSPLMNACDKNSIEKVKSLLEEGVDPNYGGECRCLPLETACSDDNYECAKLLLEYGADPNLVDKYGDLPLSTACRYGRYECVKLLLDSGAIVRYGQINDLFATTLEYPRSGLCFNPKHLKICDLLFLRKEEMEERLYDMDLPTDMIKEIHSFL